MMKMAPLLLILFFSPDGLALRPITWSESVVLTRENNPTLKSYEKNFEATKTLESATKGVFYPQISAQAQGSQSSSNPSSTTYSNSLVASQNIFNGFSDLESLNKSYTNTEIAAATLQINKAKLSHLLKAAYTNLKSSHEALSLNNEISKRRQENMRLIELRYLGGRENKGSVLLSKANFKQSKLDFLRSQHEAENAQIEFLQVIGLENSEQVELTNDIPLTESPQEKPDFILLAHTHPEYRQALANENLSKSAVEQDKASFYPSLTLSGTLGRQGDQFPPKTDAWSAALTLSIPLFSGGKDYYTYRSSADKYVATILSRISTSNSLVVNLRKSYFAFVESIARMDVDEAFKEAATLRAEVARKQYNNGLISFQEWDQIESDLILRQKNFLESKKQRILQESLWHQARGEGVF